MILIVPSGVFFLSESLLTVIQYLPNISSWEFHILLLQGKKIKTKIEARDRGLVAAEQ